MATGTLNTSLANAGLGADAVVIKNVQAGTLPAKAYTVAIKYLD